VPLEVGNPELVGALLRPAGEGDPEPIRRDCRIGLHGLGGGQPNRLGPVDRHTVEVTAALEDEHRWDLPLGSGRLADECVSRRNKDGQRDSRAHVSMISPSRDRV
jgi:hypothetical protein